MIIYAATGTKSSIYGAGRNQQEILVTFPSEYNLREASVHLPFLQRSSFTLDSKLKLCHYTMTKIGEIIN